MVVYHNSTNNHNQQPKKQPIDISWVPKHIPENGIVNPHNLIDEATINKIKELNEKWIKDPQPVRFIVLAVNELEFEHSIFAYSNAIMEKWNLDKKQNQPHMSFY